MHIFETHQEILIISVETNSGDEYLSKTVLLRKSEDTTRQQEGTDKEGVDINEVTLQWVERQFFSQQFSGLVFLDAENTFDWRAGLSHTSRYEPDRRNYQYRNDTLASTGLERRFSDLSELSFQLFLIKSNLTPSILFIVRL